MNGSKVVLVGLLYLHKRWFNKAGEYLGGGWGVDGYVVARDGKLETHTLESFAQIVGTVQNAELTDKGGWAVTGGAFYKPKGTDLKRVPKYVSGVYKPIPKRNRVARNPIVILSAFEQDGVQYCGVLMDNDVTGFECRTMTAEEAFGYQAKERQIGLPNANVTLGIKNGKYVFSRGGDLVFRGAMSKN